MKQKAPLADKKLQNDFGRGTMLPVFLLVSLVVHTLFYALHPDFATLWTLFPYWLLGAPMLVLSFFCRRANRSQKRCRLALITLWLIAILCMSDETLGVLRWTKEPPSDALRIVSLNCSVGTPEAAREVINYQPDLVLLQETPSRIDVQNLARELWPAQNGFAWGVDGAILARGLVQPLKLPANVAVFATAARVTVEGNTFVAVSCRLDTPPFRVDFWNPSAWQALAVHRHLQRGQLQALIAAIKAVEPDLPIIMAADCNAPGGDAIFRELQPEFYDAYRQGGAGWCNTFQNDFPILRIDQVWLSHQWNAVYLTAQRTKNSDHRIVICDIKPQ
jgi:endonuclease/exonuclease/phosphatase (EEP) superfamily protein YafD